jgi:hypothetical protein
MDSLFGGASPKIMMHKTLRHVFQWSAFDIHSESLRSGSSHREVPESDYPAIELPRILPSEH